MSPKKKKKQKHQRIRNPFIPALIKRRPSTHHKDKKREEAQRPWCITEEDS